MIRLTLIDLNPAELNYYPFMISLDKCNGTDYLYMRHVNSTWDSTFFNVSFEPQLLKLPNLANW